MNKPYTTPTVLALAVAALVAACGGESSAPSSAQAFAARITTNPPKSDRLKALGIGGGSTSAAATEITNAQFFQWAGQLLPSLFPPNPVSITLNAEGLVWDVRAYSSGHYLAVASNGRAYGLGPVTGNALVDLGPVQSFSVQVCSTVNCSPTGGGTGSVNECFMNASQALQTGNLWRASYVITSFLPAPSTSEFSLEARVDGPTSFEGLSAVKTTTTVTSNQQGEIFTQVASSYERAAQGGLIETLGEDSQITSGSFITRSKSVYDPPNPNSEFSLVLGGTLPKTVTSRSASAIGGGPLPPLSSPESTSSTFKYEARETISVQGRSYDVCRYRETEGDGSYQLQWHIVGKGFPVKFEQYDAGGTLAGRDEMKSGTFNGAPL